MWHRSRRAGTGATQFRDKLAVYHSPRAAKAGLAAALPIAGFMGLAKMARDRYDNRVVAVDDSIQCLHLDHSVGPMCDDPMVGSVV